MFKNFGCIDRSTTWTWGERHSGTSRTDSRVRWPRWNGMTRLSACTPGTTLTSCTTWAASRWARCSYMACVRVREWGTTWAASRWASEGSFICCWWRCCCCCWCCFEDVGVYCLVVVLARTRSTSLSSCQMLIVIVLCYWQSCLVVVAVLTCPRFYRPCFSVSFVLCQVRIKPKVRMLGEAAVHADGVWKLQNDSTKEMTAQVSRDACFGGGTVRRLFLRRRALHFLKMLHALARQGACVYKRSTLNLPASPLTLLHYFCMIERITLNRHIKIALQFAEPRRLELSWPKVPLRS